MDDLNSVKRQYLLRYRDVANGLRRKQEILYEVSKQHNIKLEKHNSLANQLAELEKLYFTFKIWYQKEEKQEGHLKFKYLRSHARHCAEGHLEYCDLSSPLVLTNVNRSYEAPSNDHALRRLEQVTCHEALVTSYERSYFHANIAEYMVFINNPNSYLYHKHNIAQIRREKLLLAPFINNGSEGVSLFVQVALEYIGLALSPITVPLKYLHRGYKAATELVFEWLQQCREGEVKCSAQIYGIAFVATEIYNEESSYHIVHEVLDYTRYSWVMTIYNRIHPAYRLLNYVSSIIMTAPDMYYIFYSKYDAIPATQNACLLRNAIVVAKEEMVRMKKVISEDENEEQTPESVDYGEGSIWQGVAGDCISKDIYEYKYELCFMKKVMQNRVLLGTFNNWGETAIEKNTDRKKNKKLTLFRPSVPKAERSAEDYTSQVYTNGATCPGGKKRSVIVRYECGQHPDIIDVTEYEVNLLVILCNMVECAQVCSYSMLVRTPLVCDERLEVDIRNALAAMNVIGFAQQEVMIDQSVSEF